MWMVRVALKRPYTIAVVSILIVTLGVGTILRMPVDIFPDIDIPVISVIWNYTGLQPEEMEKRLVTTYERTLTAAVNDIEHVESQSLTGVAVVKIFFHPAAKIEAATAQVAAISQTVLRQMPPGTSPPLIVRYNASNVPILQIALQSDTLSEQQLFDYGTSVIRSDIVTVPGAQLPWPYGGKQRQIMVDIDTRRLWARGLSPRDVTNAIAEQNLILPAGTIKMGTNEYPVLMNSSPEVIREIGDLPVKTEHGATVFVRDVADVRDGYAPQTSMVHVGGHRSVLMSILKNGAASTLDIAARVRARLPDIVAKLPKELEVALLFDQSVFVRAAVDGVVNEAVIAAGLTALMILFFLGSFRATLVVVVSIPLSILVSVIALNALGQTLNIMTLGGMSLAVGILVDDATVEVENIFRNMSKGKAIERAILEGAQEIAMPAFVSTICICIVFVPVVLISGPARALFVPLAMSVVFAMLTSYVLSRTLVPTLLSRLLKGQPARRPFGHDTLGKDTAAVVFAWVETRFVQFRTLYGGWLALALQHRGTVIGLFIALAASSLAIFPILGRDFFPVADAGLVKLHVRAPPGTRIEESEKRLAHIEATIRSVLPPHEIGTMVDIIGTPYSGLNLSLSEGALISPADGQVLIALSPGHAPTRDYVKKLRAVLHEHHPDTTFFFLAPDISTQIVNFGLAAAIDVQLVGAPSDDERIYTIAKELVAKIRTIPGAVDVHLAQVREQPQLRVEVDRTTASLAGVTQHDVANDVLSSLASSSQVRPNYWLDPKRGFQVMVAAQTPQYANDSIEALRTSPVSIGAGKAPQLLSNLANFSRSTGPANVTHYNGTRTYDVQAGVEGVDLGSVMAAVARVVDDLRSTLPRGAVARIKGQGESMQASLGALAYGLLFAVVLVYLLMVVNFQSWIDPLVILMALPGALAGAAWILFLSNTTLSVPALMGVTMCMGVASANSILVVTFANDQRCQGRSATDAALAAGMTRLRPVMMTAFAMIAGVLPMSLGVGQGAEQNAPLGRAVIGGLLLATVTTLFVVPIMYSLLRKNVRPGEDPEVKLS